MYKIDTDKLTRHDWSHIADTLDTLRAEYNNNVDGLPDSEFTETIMTSLGYMDVDLDTTIPADKLDNVNRFHVDYDGADHHQYWDGAGVANTIYNACYVGVGSDTREAFEDACENACEGGCDNVFGEFEDSGLPLDSVKSALRIAEDADIDDNGNTTDMQGLQVCIDGWHCYVVIYVQMRR